MPFIQYCLRAQRDSGNSSTNVIQIGQSLESVDSIPYAGRTVTFSFYARAGANYSAASSALAFSVRTGTGTDQNLFSGYTGQALPINSSATLTTTWQRFSATATLSSSATELGVLFEFTPVGTAGANDFFEVTGIQLEAGSTATAFQTATGTLQGELAACQRYYYTHALGNSLAIGLGTMEQASLLVVNVQFPVNMRIGPTLVSVSGTNFYGFERNFAIDSFNSFTILNSGTTNVFIYNNTEVSGTVGNSGRVTTQDATSLVAFNAEL